MKLESEKHASLSACLECADFFTTQYGLFECTKVVVIYCAIFSKAARNVSILRYMYRRQPQRSIGL